MDEIDVNAKDEYGNTALHFAVMRNDVKLMKYLLKHGARIDVKNTFGESPMSLAVEYDSDLMLYVNVPHVQ